MAIGNFGNPELRFRFDPDAASGGGGGSVQRIGLTAQQDAIKDFSLIEKISIEEIGGLSMPEQTQNKLVKLFDHWSAKFAALNAEIDQTLAESKATNEQIEKNMQHRKAILEAGPNS